MPDAPSPHGFRSGAGRLCLDFVRTLRYRGRPDVEEELATVARLTEWVALLGPCQPGESSDATGVSIDAARRLREAVYALLVASTGPEGTRSCPARPRRLINEWGARQVPAPALRPDGRVDHYAADPVAATLSLVARDVLDLVSGGDLERLRRCANPDCNIFFLDTSRPGSRRWCSMTTCGNQAKKANQRARRS
jgi:predicted RNA-binding Zn ribbon-like protein